MNFNTILAMFAASTPDGRWVMLQAWLKQHPKWQKQIDYWSTLSSEQVVTDLEVWAIEKYGAPTVLLIGDDMRLKIRAAIENLQTRYQERANNQPKQQKEIKNVKTQMDNRSDRKRAVGRQTNARAKRANED